MSECYKAAGGDLPRTASTCGGELEQDRLVINYDELWTPVDSDADISPVYRLELVPSGELSRATVSVMSDSETLVSWDVAALGVTG